MKDAKEGRTYLVDKNRTGYLEEVTVDRKTDLSIKLNGTWYSLAKVRLWYIQEEITPTIH